MKIYDSIRVFLVFFLVLLTFCFVCTSVVDALVALYMQIFLNVTSIMNYSLQ